MSRLLPGGALQPTAATVSGVALTSAAPAQLLPAQPGRLGFVISAPRTLGAAFVALRFGPGAGTLGGQHSLTLGSGGVYESPLGGYDGEVSAILSVGVAVVSVTVLA